MAVTLEPLPATRALRPPPAGDRVVLPILTLCWREFIRFIRQRNRVIGALLQPVIFWVLFGAGLNGSFRPGELGGTMDYRQYFFPGTVILILLFTAIFSTISVIEDRREGFLQGVLVAPIPRSSMVLGKVFGGTLLAVLQGLIFLALAPLVGVPISPMGWLLIPPLLALIGFGLTALSFCIAWPMDSTQGFHAIMTVFLMPLWLLSGAFFPIPGRPAWLAWTMRLNPLTYGVAGLRRLMDWGRGQLPPPSSRLPGLGVSVAVTAIFCLVAFGLALVIAGRRGPRTNP